VLLQACLNGGSTRQTHPSVPQTPAELAADASAVVGLQDTVVLEDGRLASGNRKLVQAAAQMIPEVQPSVGLTADEAVVCTPLVMPAFRPGREPAVPCSAPSSRGLGRRPLKAVTPVRIRSGLLLMVRPSFRDPRFALLVAGETVNSIGAIGYGLAWPAGP
jgi:hypothetical protein